MALNNATTGEDTLTNEKLSALRTVGSGFGCLIYDLPKEAGFEVLKQQCVLLWENMITTPKLPQCLVSICISYNTPSRVMARIYARAQGCEVPQGPSAYIYMCHNTKSGCYN